MSMERISPVSTNLEAPLSQERSLPEREKRTWKHVFNVEESEFPYAFYLASGPSSSVKTAYASIHFDGKVFRSPDDKKEISVSEFSSLLKEKMKVDKIILSCCYPDKAKEVIGDVPDLEVLGVGDCEVRTIYNDRKKIITVETVC